MRASAALRTGTPRTLVAVAETVVGEEGVEKEPDGFPFVVVEELGGLEGQPEPVVIGEARLVPDDDRLRLAKAFAAKAERAKRREEKLAATAARQAAARAARGPWGGAREGAGRPRVHATNAERQAAYRARRRQETT